MKQIKMDTFDKQKISVNIWDNVENIKGEYLSATEWRSIPTDMTISPYFSINSVMW